MKLESERIISPTSTIEAQRVESLTSVEEVERNELSSKSIQEISTALVKETLFKVLSKEKYNLNGTPITEGEIIEIRKSVEIIVIESLSRGNLNRCMEELGKSQPRHVAVDHSGRQTDSSEARLYSTSSTHLCSKLSETINATNHAMSDSVLDMEVETTLKANMEQLGKEFESQNSVDKSKSSLVSIQSLGQSILDREISETEHNIASAELTTKYHRSTLEKPEIERELEDSVVRLKEDIVNLHAEIEMLRPSGEEVLTICSALHIDPSIATVFHLLTLLQSSTEQREKMKERTDGLNRKLLETTNMLRRQKDAYLVSCY